MNTIIILLGWAALGLGGGYLVFAGCFLLLHLTHKAGLEYIAPHAIIASIITFAWLVFVIWLSPLTLSFGANP